MDYEMLFKFFRGEAAPAEESEIEKWLDADPANRREFRSAQFIFEGLALYGEPSARPAQNPVRPLWQRVVRHTVRIAALVALVAVTAYVVQRKTFDRVSDRMTSLTVPYGQRIRISLPDGSDVWLNSGARIEYPVIFKRGERRVSLSGEALFEVRHDEKCPFVVRTYASDIEVLGTKFNVVADEAHDRFSTALIEGRVQLSNRIDPRQPKIVMHPSEVVDLVDGRLAVAGNPDPEEMLCWTEGLVNIGGLSFAELMDKFEQVFDVRIVVARQTLPELGEINGKIRVNDGIDNALRIVQHAADFSYEKNVETNVVTIF